MEYYTRHIEPKLMELFRHFPVIALLGARQTGKSTLVHHLPIQNLSTVVFDPVQDMGNAREDPDFFLQNKSLPLFLDEIQYAPELLAAIKRYVDIRQEVGLFILTGSQHLSVMKSISESLAGRVAVINLHPMSSREQARTPGNGFFRDFFHEPGFDPFKFICSAFRPVFPFIWKGGFPGLLSLPHHLYASFFESYLRTYIERDVRAVSGIGSLQTFGRFFGLLAALTGQEINHNQLGRELGIDRKTALAWTEIATSTFQWHQVPAFSRNVVKKISGKSKGYFADTGFACYLQRIMTPDVLMQHPLGGRLFETFVFLEILKQVDTWPMKPAMYHFRSYSGAEVDLILEMNGVLHPVEIKMKSHPSKRDCSGIMSFRQYCSGSDTGTGFIVCSTDTIEKVHDDVYAVPWWEV